MTKFDLQRFTDDTATALATAEAALLAAAATLATSSEANVKDNLIAKLKAEIVFQNACKAAGQEYSAWVIARDTFYISVLEDAHSLLQSLLIAKMTEL